MTGAEVRGIPVLAGPLAVGLLTLVDPPARAFDIVFVHGFGGHAHRTWEHKSAVTKSSEESDDEGQQPPRKLQKLLNPPKLRLPRPHSSNPVFWPTDLLPRTAPNARILTYGYDINARDGLETPISPNGVYDIARDLMRSLEAVRRSHPSRPLLFVAHSLGGIVVKEMLRQSWGHICHQTHLLSIADSTVGALFFGTPHGGANPGGLVQSIAESVVRLSQWRAKERILDTLLPSSDHLKQLRAEFGLIAREKKWIIYCFQEEYPVKDLNGKVVEDSASCFNDATIKTVQHIASNHMDMCRFSGFDDPEYVKVAAAVERILTSASNRTFPNNDVILDRRQQRKYIEHLKFAQIDARHATFKTAHVKTCRWLLKRPEYRDWLDPTKVIEHSGFLWIKGEPGTGKSTIMKYALTQTRRVMTDAYLISFFFNARGEQLEKMTLGMYRSLLLQLLEILRNSTIVLNKRLATQLDIAGKEISWDLQVVKAVFQAALQGLGDRKVVCFIDTLDECDEDDVRDMISFFEQMCEKAVESRNQFLVCFSSRHYPHIAITKSIELVLEEQEGHREDLAKYLDSELKIGSSKESQELKEEILRRASGVFLWVVLVVQILKKEYGRECVHTLRKRLDKIPNGLCELFRDIITADSRNGELILCLQWILYAKRPLKREELYFAVLTGVEPRSVSEWDTEKTTIADMERFILDWSKGLAELSKTKDQTVQFIHESVRDFLFKENSLGLLHPRLTNNIAGISHDDLKACCQNRLGIVLAQSVFVEDMYAAFFEESVQIRQKMCEKWPLLDYAVKYTFEHAEAAARHEVSQDSYLESLQIPVHPYWRTFNRSSWIYLHNILERYQTRRYTPDASFLYIFAEKNLPNLIRTVLKRTRNMDIAGERRGFPLNAAIAQGNEDAIREFLKPAAALPSADRPPWFAQSSSRDSEKVDVARFFLQRARDIATPKYSVLAWAVAHAEQSTIACLAATGKVGTVGLDYQYTLAKTTTEFLHVSLVIEGAQLVSTKIRMDTKRVPLAVLQPTDPASTPKGSRRLFWAAYLMQNIFSIRDNPLEVPIKVLFDEEGWMEFLMHDKGVDPNQCDAESRTCLILAAGLGLKAQLESLLEQNGLDVNKADNKGNTALHHAVRDGHEDVVRMLLGRSDLDINQANKLGQTALHCAVKSKQILVVKILLREEHLTAICGAETSTETMVSATNVGDNARLHQSLDTNVTYLGCPPSSSDVARTGKPAQTPTLNHQGINVNVTDNFGSTALHMAVELCQPLLVKMLLERTDINIHIADNNRVTPLVEAGRRRMLAPLQSDDQRKACAEIVGMLERKMRRGMLVTAL